MRRYYEVNKDKNQALESVKHFATISTMKELERSLFTDVKLRRRTFLGALAVGGGYTLLEGVGDLRKLRILYEMLRSEKLKDSSAYSSQIKFEPTLVKNRVIAFGDSNMIGAWGDRNNAPPALVSNQMNEKKIYGEWKKEDVKNFAQYRATTHQVKQYQLHSQEAQKAVMEWEGEVDFWFNVSPNNFRELVQTEEDARQLILLAKDPLQWRTLDIVDRAHHIAKEAGKDFYDLLAEFTKIYKGKIRHLIIVAPSDFSNAPSINFDTGDRKFRLPLNNKWTNLMVYNASLRLANEITAAVDFYRKKYPKISSHAVKTFGFTREQFGADEHYSRNGDDQIAADVLSRVTTELV